MILRAESCTGVECGTDKTCVMRSGSPKCICSPNCKRHDGLRVKGPVCGTDGISYKSHCRLKKRSCRTRDQSLVVAYHGLCQSEYDELVTMYRVQRGDGVEIIKSLGQIIKKKGTLLNSEVVHESPCTEFSGVDGCLALRRFPLIVPTVPSSLE